MLTGEKSNETSAVNPRWCAKCGASLEAPREEVQPGVPVCEVCGARIVPLETHYTPEAPLATTGSEVPPVQPSGPRRNPLALVVVALVAAGMLFLGIHSARRSGTNH